MSTFQNSYVDKNTYIIDFDQFKESQPPPLKKSYQNQGGLKGVQPPLPKFRGVATPPTPPCLAPLVLTLEIFF